MSTLQVVTPPGTTTCSHRSRSVREVYGPYYGLRKAFITSRSCNINKTKRRLITDAPCNFTSRFPFGGDLAPDLGTRKSHLVISLPS